jgi:succinate dehydrogenase/fumarate reductase flavoprotein subunit
MGALMNRPPDLATPIDVLVAGAGMAGLCAGLAAAEAGARVLVLEKGPAPGGSMRMSGGTVWTAPSMEVMERWAPLGDRARQQTLVDGIDDGLAWLAGHGIPRTFDIENPRQTGAGIDVEVMTAGLVAAIEARGGEVRTRSALRELVRDADGRVTGVVAALGGRRTEIAAGAVILATGGFGGNKELVARYITPNAETMLLRANPRSVGDGLLAALDAGARTSPNLATFYGHTMPLVDDLPPTQWVATTAYYTQDAVVLNARGERFFDESISMADEQAPAHIARQPGGIAVVILDDRVYRHAAGEQQSSTEPAANWDRAAAAGAPHAEAWTLEELAAAIGAWGFSPIGALDTLRAYNAAIAAGTAADLPVARRGNRIGVVTPPFRALAVRAGITFTLGGVDTDVAMRVLDRDGEVIPGLYAAGADAGGTYQGGYMGGLVLGLVHGGIAGTGAASARSRTA